jgi:hypothetical protein
LSRVFPTSNSAFLRHLLIRTTCRSARSHGDENPSNPCHFGSMTLLNCLAAAFPPQERVVTCEEISELKNP